MARDWISNDGWNWVLHTTLLSAVSISTPPYDSVADIGPAMNGAYGKLRVFLGGTAPEASLRASYCGRTN